METQLRFAPIIRVSTERQEQQGESLKVQEKQIRQYVKNLNGVIPEYCWQYIGQEHATPQYERKMVDKLLTDSGKGLFDAVIVCDPSRWSRDNQKSKQGLEILRSKGIRFFVGTTEYDLFNPTQNLFLGMSAEIGEYQAMEQARKSIMSRIEKTRRGYPSAGSIPFGRIYDGKTGKWSVDPDKKKFVQQAAQRYLNGEKIIQIAASYGMPIPTLWKYLTKIPGKIWTVKFENKRLNIKEVIDVEVGELLDEATIKAIKNKAAANKTYTHGEIINKYLLSRMVFCAKCGYTYYGQWKKSGTRYYRHIKYPGKGKCAKHYVPANELENTVLLHIVKTFGDPERIRQAVERATPNEAKRRELEEEKKQWEKEIEKITNERNNVMEFIKANAITKEDARQEMNKLREQQKAINERLTVIHDQLMIMPDPDDLKRLSKLSTNILSNAIKNSPEKALTKPYEWKRKLMEHAFAGHDSHGNRLGVYIEELESEGRKFKIEVRGSLESTIIGLPLSDQYLHELFHLDPDYQDINKELKEIRANLVTNYISSMPQS